MSDEHTTEQTEDAALPEEMAPQPDSGQPADGGGVAHQEPADVDQLRRERDDCHERLVRTTADFDNYRKRTDRERRELTEYAAMDLLTDLLPVVDDFERALATDVQEGDAYRRGVEIIHKQLLDLMSRRGVTPIEAVGTDFDPNLHQAVVHEPSPAHRDGEVIEELRRGYTLRDRLLRASMVKVAKA
jgi:molecular chaperone GrpE